MAKILTGPLAAGLSGKLGPVVFHQTRFGQTVQSKAKPRTYTTPAALATKFAFGTSSRAVSAVGAYQLSLLDEVCRRAGKSARGQLIQAWSATIRGETPAPWPQTGLTIADFGWTLGAPYREAGRTKVPYTDSPLGAALQGLGCQFDPSSGWHRTFGFAVGFEPEVLVSPVCDATLPIAALFFIQLINAEDTNRLDKLGNLQTLLIPAFA